MFLDFECSEEYVTIMCIFICMIAKILQIEVF